MSLTMQEKNDLYQQCFPIGIRSLKTFPVMRLKTLKQHRNNLAGFQGQRIERATMAPDHCFVHNVSTQDMSPRFPIGTTLVVDIKRKALANDFVFVYSQEYDQVFFRQYVIEDGDEEFRPTHEQADYFYRTYEDKILGVMVEAETFFNQKK